MVSWETLTHVPDLRQVRVLEAYIQQSFGESNPRPPQIMGVPSKVLMDFYWSMFTKQCEGKEKHSFYI